MNSPAFGRYLVFLIAMTCAGQWASGADQPGNNRLLVTAGEYHLLKARQGAAAVARDHFIYVVGGMARGALTDIERFDVRTHQIVRVTDRLQPRRYHNAIEYQGRIYIFGGQGYGSAEYPDEERVEIFDCASGTLSFGTRMPIPGEHMAAVRLGTKVYLCGGTRKKASQVSQWSDTDIYDLETGVWTQGAAMPMPRETSGALVGEFMIVPGGFRARRADASVDFYIPRENSWRSLPPLSRPVSAHATVFLDKYLFLFGDYAKLNSVLAYDLGKRATLDLVTDYKGRRHAAAVVLDNVIYVIGGNTTQDADESDLIQAFTINPNYRP